jgi:hypothetical protein
MNLLETAIQWLVQGFSVIPLIFRDKKPDSNLLPGYQWKPYQTQLPTLDELVWWFSTPHNIGLVTGWNNLVVIDFDNMDVFNLWYSLYPLKTFMVKTRRGVHVYLKIQEPTSSLHTQYIDIKAAGGYVLIPPSIHPSGFEYEVFSDAPILSVPLLDEILPGLFIPIKYLDPVDAQPTAPLDPWIKASNPVQYADGLINSIRQKIKIESYFPHAIKSGDHWMKAVCPFHNDKSPSLWIDTRRGLCGCYVCNIKPMDIINLYARLNHTNNHEAILSLAARL